MTTTQTRTVPTLYDKYGRPYCGSLMSRTRDTVRAKCILPPDKVIPVIFVPGIMGSNLKSSATNAIDGKAWAPDTIQWAKKFLTYNPAERQQLLNPALAQIDDSADIPDAEAEWFADLGGIARANWKAEFKRRGWGTVMLSSYGPLLYYLEFQLNRMYQSGEIAAPWQTLLRTTGEDWGTMQGFIPLAVRELQNAADYWYPVHAAGYNWLASNKEAGIALAGKIDTVIGHYRNYGYDCDKVILVTHSMGGLVARAACHPKIGNSEGKVLGIVHGVQPAIGAATAYKRVLAGFEADGLSAALAAGVLGWSGKHVTAVFANAPGALELLPNKLYPPGWLKITRARWGASPSQIAALPKSDPYEEIYRVKDKWWRLMDPSWVDPAKMITDRTSWEQYLFNLKKAENFHYSLGEYYHLSTWAHYGADEKKPAWGQVCWSQPGSGGHLFDTDILEAQLQANNALGTVILARGDTRTSESPKAAYGPGGVTQARNGTGSDRSGISILSGWNQVIDPPISPGDGTVPEVSGRAPEGKARFVARMSYFGHQDSYASPRVQSLTLYCVAKIAGENA